MKKLTHEEFLEKLYENNEHYRKGDFVVDDVYENQRTHLRVVDTNGLEYKIKAGSLLGGNRVTIVASSDKSKHIKSLFYELHGDRYNYDNVEYINDNTKVDIVCPIHGSFYMTPALHMIGSGCPICARKLNNPPAAEREVNFIEKSKLKHNNRYTYDKVNYVDTKSKVVITCNIHGDFLQSPSDHIQGDGCSKCKKDLVSALNRGSVESFIEKSSNIHSNKYNYDNVVYNGAGSKVDIICPIHGVFSQTPHDHIGGHGCRLCSIDKLSERMKYEFNTLSYTQWGNMGSRSKDFESYKVYIVVLGMEDESFIKIGKTFRTIKKRFKEVPYKYSIHNTIIKEDPIEICKIEHELKTKLKSYRYQPQKQFGGQFECFSIDALHSGAVDELIKNYTDVSG